MLVKLFIHTRSSFNNELKGSDSVTHIIVEQVLFYETRFKIAKKKLLILSWYHNLNCKYGFVN